MSHITLDGVQYVVSPQFAAAIERDLGTLTFSVEGAERERLALLHLSNRRALFTEDRTQLDALTHVKNVASAICWAGAHRDPMKDFGFDGWDAVHGNTHTDDCGCVDHYVYDHHSVVNHFGHNRVIPTLEDVIRLGVPLTVRDHYEIRSRSCAAHAVRMTA